MNKKVLVGVVIAILVVVVAVLVYTTYFGERILCDNCNENTFFEKQGHVMYFWGEKLNLCPECYEKYFSGSSGN